MGATKGWEALARRGSILRRLAEPGESVRDTLLRIVVERWDEDGQPVLSADGIELLARSIRIQDHELPRDVLWDPYDAQIWTWRHLCRHQWVYFLKSRQIGVTLATLLFDIIWTAVRDAKGYWVETALIWDTYDKAGQIVGRCVSMVRQLGIPLRKRPTAKRISFPNRSAIQARAAASKGSTRGLSYHRYHCSEMPFWPNAGEMWEAMRPSLNLGAPVTWESTMSVVKDPFAGEQWRKDNRFGKAPGDAPIDDEGTMSVSSDGRGVKAFYSMETHREYRLEDLGLIPDEQWERLNREEGFQRRDSAAWWWRKNQDEDDGDEHRTMREYPAKASHCFALQEGKYITRVVQETKPLMVRHHKSSDGARRYKLEIRRMPEDTSGQLELGVDTAGGTGGDKSAMVVIDKADMAICASFASEWIDTFDYASIIAEAWDIYQDSIVYKRLEETNGRERDVEWLPDLIATVETNGRLGKSCYNELRALGVPVRPFKTGTEQSGTREQVLHYARLWIEKGRAYGPKTLADECMHLTRLHTTDKKDGGWRGHDDMIMAYGMAALEAKRRPWLEKPVPLTADERHAQRVNEILREEEAGHRRRI